MKITIVTNNFEIYFEFVGNFLIRIANVNTLCQELSELKKGNILIYKQTAILFYFRKKLKLIFRLS